MKTAFRAKQQGNANLFPTSVLSASGSFKVEAGRLEGGGGKPSTFYLSTFYLKMGIISASWKQQKLQYQQAPL
ncbi:hypothetical protein [Pedobacter suwonensis]|uniref:hypothetical protein n=1 Tax=Pedobacter suwonensis TaxID=332999 RepID=UPI0037F64D97